MMDSDGIAGMVNTARYLAEINGLQWSIVIAVPLVAAVVLTSGPRRIPNWPTGARRPRAGLGPLSRGSARDLLGVRRVSVAAAAVLVLFVLGMAAPATPR